MDCTETIQRQVNNIQTLVSDFSNFARMPESVFTKVKLSKIIEPQINTIKILDSKIKFIYKNSCKELKINCDENQIGRVMSIRHGPRLIDIDIVFFQLKGAVNTVIDTNLLTIPHPMWKERLFVIEPMSELDISEYMHSLISFDEVEKLKLNQRIFSVTELDI